MTPFPKIPRLNRDIIITEKIDGTNAAIVIEEEMDWPGEPGGGSSPVPNGNLIVTAQSRTRELRQGEQDNFGFRAWVEKNAEVLKMLGPGVHFGEWWGHGIQRGYGLSEKRFSLFNTERWADNGEPLTQDRINFLAVHAILPEINVVPILYKGPWMEDSGCIVAWAPGRTLYTLAKNGSYASPGFMNPEGIIVFHKAGNLLFKATIENDAYHKGESN